MYQGKFASKDKKGNLPQRTEQIPRGPRPAGRTQENLSDAGRPAARPVPQSSRNQPPRPMPRQETVQRPMPQSRPAAGNGMNQRPPYQKPMPQNVQPFEGMPEPMPRKRHYGGLIFYILFFACLFAIYTFTYVKLGDLQDWLVRYEAAQPTHMYEQVFQTYFEHPNWGLLYDNAGIPESQYEGKEAFVAYMEEKVGDTALTGLETSNGLSRDKRYIVRLGDEKIASFTLVDQNHATEKTDIPNWQLGEIELYYERVGTYYVKTVQGQQAQVNGVPLEEMNTIRVSTTKANTYLPEGVSAPLTAVHQVDGLMVKPTVTVTGADGKAVETSYDEDTHTFTVPAADGAQMDADLKAYTLSAIKTYAMYMSVKGGLENELANYFQRGTELFKTFTSMERTWNQRYKDHSFSDDKVTDYVRYSEDLFSARVSTSLHLQRTDGTEKVTLLDQSMFFKKINGQWKCYEMTAVDVSEPVEQVRLTFRNGTQILKTELVDASLAKVECPAVEVPQGKKFLGWVVEERKENGDRVMRLTLEPDESNVAAAPAEGLSPMVLLPLFE